MAKRQKCIFRTLPAKSNKNTPGVDYAPKHPGAKLNASNNHPNLKDVGWRDRAATAAA